MAGGRRAGGGQEAPYQIHGPSGISAGRRMKGRQPLDMGASGGGEREEGYKEEGYEEDGQRGGG